MKAQGTRMSLLEKKWKRRTTGASYTVDETATRWTDALSRTQGKVSQQKAARPKKITRRVQINSR
ncbi:MAG: hypothetical protein MUP90_00415 [Gammaproteobacteria bacterium]|nr:hypothetical protein [Gammaproteobacteria bacterium]